MPRRYSPSFSQPAPPAHTPGMPLLRRSCVGARLQLPLQLRAAQLLLCSGLSTWWHEPIHNPPVHPFHSAYCPACHCGPEERHPSHTMHQSSPHISTPSLQMTTCSMMMPSPATLML